MYQSDTNDRFDMLQPIVSSDSQLGQYLQELDENATCVRSSCVSHPLQPTAIESASDAIDKWTVKWQRFRIRLIQSLNEDVVQTLEYLLSDAWSPVLRDDESLLWANPDDFVQSKSIVWTLFYPAASMTWTMALLVVVLAAASTSETIASPSASTVILILVLTPTLLLALVELVWQAARQYSIYLARHLVTSIHTVEASQRSFEEHFNESIRMIKSAEIASRGYKVGLHLPPILRLETSSTHLECLPLRKYLHQVNENTSNALYALTNNKESEVRIKQSNDRSMLPSLLLSSLCKRHNYTMEYIVEVLQSDVKRILSIHLETATWTSFFSNFHKAKWKSDRVCDLLAKVDRPLGRYLDRCSRSKRSEPHQATQTRESNDNELDDALTDLQTANDTLSSLLFAINQTSKSKPKVEAKRGLVEKSVQELQSSWMKLDRTIRGLSTGDSTSNLGVMKPSENAVEEKTTVNGRNEEVAQPEGEEDDATYVFTATGVGDDGFDLKQLVDATNERTAGPRFMDELQDVLQMRQVQTSRKEVVKSMDDDILPREEKSADTSEPVQAFPGMDLATILRSHTDRMRTSCSEGDMFEA